MSEYQDFVCQDCGRDMSQPVGQLGENALSMHSMTHKAEELAAAWEKLGTEVYAAIAVLRALAYNIKALDLEDAFHNMTDKLCE